MKPFSKSFVAAAGLGMRLRPLTEVTPKPLVSFLGIPMIEYPLQVLKDLGVQHVAINAFHLKDQMVAFEAKLRARQLFESSKCFLESVLLGGAGGIKNAEEFFLEEPNFLFLNGDEVLFNLDLNAVQSGLRDHTFAAPSRLATIFVCKDERVGKGLSGVWLDSANHVVGFGKVPPGPGFLGAHFFGLIALSSEVLRHIPSGVESNIFYDILVKLLAPNVVTAVFVDCHHVETGNLRDLRAGEEWCLKQKAHSPIKVGSQDLDVFLKSRKPGLIC